MHIIKNKMPPLMIALVILLACICISAVAEETGIQEITVPNTPVKGLIQIDGGVYADNVRAVEEAGVDIAVAGSAVFGASDPAAAIKALRGA